MADRRSCSRDALDGQLHLGHYFGTLKNWSTSQAEHDCYYFAADFHALTTDTRAVADRASTFEAVADGCGGRRPERATIFVQSWIPEHAELHLLLSMITPLAGSSACQPTRSSCDRSMAATWRLTASSAIRCCRPPTSCSTGRLRAGGGDQASHLEITANPRRFNRSTVRSSPSPRHCSAHAEGARLDGRKIRSRTATPSSVGQSRRIRAKCKSMFRTRRAFGGLSRPSGELHLFHSIACSRQRTSSSASTATAARRPRLRRRQAPDADQIIAFLDPIRRKREDCCAIGASWPRCSRRVRQGAEAREGDARAGTGSNGSRLHDDESPGFVSDAPPISAALRRNRGALSPTLPLAPCRSVARASARLRGSASTCSCI